MSRLTVKFKKLKDSATLPKYMTDQAAGMDLFVVLDEPLCLAPGERTLLPTGLAMEIPLGFEGQVRPRSGLALKKGIALVNAPGTIDADYRGEIGVIVINHGKDAVVFTHGDRIAQLVIAPVHQADIALVDELGATERAAGGFGHTGGTGRKQDGTAA